MPLHIRLAGLIGAFAFVFSAAAQAEPLTVRLDFIPVGFHAAMHLAKEKGWFAREGLEVDIQDGTGSLNTIQLVGSGQVDVGQVQLGVMAIAREKGVPVKSFAGFVRKSDLGVIVPRELRHEDGEGPQRQETTVLHGEPVGALHRQFPRQRRA